MLLENSHFCLLLLTTCFGISPDSLPPENPPPRAPEIKASEWLNAQPVRLHATPKAVLVAFFETDSRQAKPLGKALNQLHKKYDDGSLIVVALTEDGAKEAERFVRREKVRFQIGAESKSAKAFQVKEMPAAVLVSLKDRRILWRAEGEKPLTEKALRTAVAEAIGTREAHERSALWIVEEEANRELAFARAETAERELDSIVLSILEDYPAEASIEEEALFELDDFVELYGPSDPKGQSAPSEEMARTAAMGFGGESGYGRLYSSGRLSDSAKQAVRDRLISAAEKDSSVAVRMTAVGTLRKTVGQRGDPELLDALRRMRAAEPDPYVRGAIDQALDELDPGLPAEKRAELQRPKAMRLRKQLEQAADPTTSRWADAHAYMQQVGERSISDLVQDYLSSPDVADARASENAAIKRLTAIDEIENRLYAGDVREVNSVRGDLLAGLGLEPDPTIRMRTVNLLSTLGQKVGPDVRQELIVEFEHRADIETDGYLVKPAIEAALAELRKSR